MRFKAKLLSGKVDPLSNKSFPSMTSPYCLEFSKNKIYFTKEVIQFINGISSLYFPFGGKESIRHTDKYTLIRLEDDDISRVMGSKFQIKLQSGATFNISSGGWQGIKMRLVHQRYSIQIHWEWYWKTIVSILFGTVIAYFSGKISYKEGYREGLMEGRNSKVTTNASTDSIPK